MKLVSLCDTTPIFTSNLDYYRSQMLVRMSLIWIWKPCRFRDIPCDTDPQNKITKKKCLRASSTHQSKQKENGNGKKRTNSLVATRGDSATALICMTIERANSVQFDRYDLCFFQIWYRLDARKCFKKVHLYKNICRVLGFAKWLRQHLRSVWFARRPTRMISILANGSTPVDLMYITIVWWAHGDGMEFCLAWNLRNPHSYFTLSCCHRRWNKMDLTHKEFWGFC